MRAITLAAAVVSAAPAPAATLRVPEDYSSILAAVDAAVAGDSVLVGPGTWTQTATRIVSVNGQSIPVTACAFLKPGLVVLSTGGSAVTSLQPTSGEGLVHVTSGAAKVIVEGLAVTASEAVVASQNSVLEIRNCWLVDNATLAMSVALSGHVILRDCVVEGNGWNSNAEALAVLSSTLEVYDCEIRDNLGDHALYVRGAPQVVVDGCTVSGHKNFGACLFEDVLDLQVRNSTFAENTDRGSGAGVNTVDSFGVVEFCVFTRDSAGVGATGGGGGFAMIRGSVRVENNTFYACHAGGLGSAMTISGNDPGVRNNIFAYSTGQYGAVNRSQGINDPTTGCNVFWANGAGDFSPFGTWTASPTDIFADPQFCDPGSGDFTLHSDSPGAPGVTPACGPIGGLGVGCGAVSIEPMSWGRIKAGFRSR